MQFIKYDFIFMLINDIKCKIVLMMFIGKRSEWEDERQLKEGVWHHSLMTNLSSSSLSTSSCWLALSV